jgi:hypothetical protein
MKRISSFLFAGLSVLLFTAIVFAQSVEDVVVTLHHPTSGQAFTPGETVEILWTTTVPKGLDCSWCEQEIYLSLDGGQTLSRRITRQLGPDAGKFSWLVPDTPSNNAMLVMQFGIEGSLSSEIRPTQSSAQFQILPAAANLEAVRMLPYDGSAPVAGQKVKIRWESTVSSVRNYEVYVSFDRGAHFQKLADARRKRLSWKIPKDFRGSAVFRIDAVRKDGSIVESSVNAEPDLFVP